MATEKKTVRAFKVVFDPRHDAPFAEEFVGPDYTTSEDDDACWAHPANRYNVRITKDAGKKIVIELDLIDEEARKKLIKEMANTLAGKSNLKVEDVIADALNDLNFQELKGIASRVKKPASKVKARHGCMKLLIGGKRGAVEELQIRS